MAPQNGVKAASVSTSPTSDSNLNSDRTSALTTNGWTGADEVSSRTENRGFAGTTYLRGTQLGSGGWAVVYKVLRVSDGQVLAGKASHGIQELHKEVEILKSLQHKHILKYVGWHEEKDTPDATLLLTELCLPTSLQGRIDSAIGPMGKTDILRVVIHISDALQYLHGRNLYHSDVKPRNIFLRSLHPIEAVLGDCADIKTVGYLKGPPRGTKAYSSPEILRFNRHYGPSDDMWALGISLLGMVAQWPPMTLTVKGVRGYPKRCFDHVEKLKSLNTGNGLVELLGRTLAWEVRDRATAEECGHFVRELLDGVGVDVSDEETGIRIPDDFQAISFW